MRNDCLAFFQSQRINAPHFFGIQAAGVEPLVWAPVRVGRRDLVHVRPLCEPSLALVLIWRHLDQRAGVPVVRRPEHQHIHIPSEGPCEPQRQVIGLRARVDEEDRVQLLGERVEQPLGIGHPLGAQVSRVGVDFAQLLRRNRCQARVRVAWLTDKEAARQVDDTGT